MESLGSVKHCLGTVVLENVKTKQITILSAIWLIYKLKLKFQVVLIDKICH